MEKKTEKELSIMNFLNQYGGLHDIKAELAIWEKHMKSLDEVYNYAKYIEENHGLDTNGDNFLRYYRMIFVGNKGTGKKLAAKEVSTYLYHAGILKCNDVQILKCADLADTVNGQISTIIKNEIERAIDGVLYVEEPYTLFLGEKDTYRREALEVLVECINDFKGRIVVIFSGNEKKMEEFMAEYPVLQSIIGLTYKFKNYDMSDALEIIQTETRKRDYGISGKAKEIVKCELYTCMDSDNYCNGITIMELVDDLISASSVRIANSKDGAAKEIIEDDVYEMMISRGHMDPFLEEIE